MKLTGLEPLYQSMRAQKMTRTKFKITINKAIFSIIYFIDSKPHKLAIGIHAKNVFFEIPVNKGFTIKAYIDKHYKDVYEALGLSPNSTNPFSSRAFFEEINKRIPTTTNPGNTPKPRDVIYFRKDVEEAEKIYFFGWKDNDIRGEKLSDENLHKTRQLLDEKAYIMCKTYNISSRWTDDSAKEVAYTSPRKGRLGKNIPN
ncbi:MULTISPECIES: DUF6037 family protein [Bacillus]|nr:MULTISPECIES: DUF6037 family protein [Bacillus]KAB0449334.1 hypothetical protein CH334_05340 [Lysinibacillus sp. VIA-II-2016]EOP32245.1 hypothetical protein IG5_05756 [Bacillus toyonensis]KAB2355859.1 hypothetical protein F8503_25795 [Bacillus toyonensis]KAB2379828.1 hypothetical protein F8507_28455 [Bacillus toyonensis]MBJ8133457.1 hypothetical protein [Bacillus cereus group sp. N3]